MPTAPLLLLRDWGRKNVSLCIWPKAANNYLTQNDILDWCEISPTTDKIECWFGAPPAHLCLVHATQETRIHRLASVHSFWNSIARVANSLPQNVRFFPLEKKISQDELYRKAQEKATQHFVPFLFRHVARFRSINESTQIWETTGVRWPFHN